MKKIFLSKENVSKEEKHINLDERKMIRAQLEKLMALSSRDFAHYQISLDPIKGKIS